MIVICLRKNSNYKETVAIHDLDLRRFILLYNTTVQRFWHFFFCAGCNPDGMAFRVFTSTAPLPTSFFCFTWPKATQRLRETVLELLVAVVSSPRPGTKDAALTFAASSLPAVLSREFLEQSGVQKWGWGGNDDDEAGGCSPRAR